MVTLRSEYQVEGEEGCPKQAVPQLGRRKRCKMSKVYLHTHTYIYIKPVYKAESGPKRVACPR